MVLNEQEKRIITNAIEKANKDLDTAGIISIKIVIDRDGRMQARAIASFTPLYPGDPASIENLWSILTG